MTPRQFAARYQYDDRLVNGQFYSSDPLQVEEGETVGVVLLNLGGPERSEDVAPFLYNLFMDPAIIDLPVKGIWRHWLSALISRLRSASVRQDYEMIGGGSPINRLTSEQSAALEDRLNNLFGAPANISFRTYMAMRYWRPFSEDAARQMQEDGVDKVLLLPLYPQFSKTTTGSSFAYWWHLEQCGDIPSWPTTHVFEYAAHPKYVTALSERIDEGLQRFPKSVRDDVQLVFSAHGTPLREMKNRRDPYCCHVHATVDCVMRQRGHDLPCHVAFQSKVGPAEWLTPSTPDKLEELASEGHETVLVMPVAFVTDHIETAYELDIEVREHAESIGIEHYEVTSGLNCHPLFIEALAEATISQLVLPEDGLMEHSAGDGAASDPASYLPLDQLPLFHTSERRTRCAQCEFIAEARRWNDRPGGPMQPPPPQQRPHQRPNSPQHQRQDQRSEQRPDQTKDQRHDQSHHRSVQE